MKTCFSFNAANYHSHTEFCDGRKPMAEIAASAFSKGFTEWGISPHSPVCCDSGANMNFWDVPAFLKEADRLKRLYEGKMKVLAGMEIDYISPQFGPHIDYFRMLPLDYRIGSVHFVKNKEGRPVDVDGPAERFIKYLESEYDGDLRYVAETYFQMELEMLDLGGFDILGHLDKIGDNGSAADPCLEDHEWYAPLVESVIAKAVDKNMIIEINTKAFPLRGRFFPAVRWWPLLKKHEAKIVLSTDAHYPERVDAGYAEAMHRLEEHDLISHISQLP